MGKCLKRLASGLHSLFAPTKVNDVFHFHRFRKEILQNTDGIFMFQEQIIVCRFPLTPNAIPSFCFAGSTVVQPEMVAFPMLLVQNHDNVIANTRLL